MKKTLFVLIAIFISLSTFAQKEKIELKLTLRDGNVVSGTSASISTVSLNTDWGKLEIPIKDVSSLEFGINPDVANKSKIINMVKAMNVADETKRQAAYDELVKMDIGAIPIIDEYIYSNEYTTSEYTDYTAEAAVSEMKSTYGVDEGYNAKDIVTINYEYNIGGIFSIKAITLKTEYGDLNIPKEKIKEAEVTYYNMENGDKSFKILANKHISGNENGGWLNTGIKVKSGQKINITSSGEIVLESLSGNKYTPDGSSSADYEDYNTESTYPSYGNLVYKIGEDGTMIKAGSKYFGTAKESGTIFLSIYETVYNSSNTGFFTAKVSVK
ncbi:MAG TPA: hypothetical protein PKK00_06390 [Bacteroidales bacterium]|nr:hypothetical protein [Bacteroidales bacterium]HPS16918.1 hypothetical protein [Bacteroidales bacterium]